ncbi:MAG TPA: hypothetical protein VGP82_07255 [Ktedonobacterales bacterium]|jgi:hypothetical protein|nr:hypothetical protein [Ktedonobacterales bacterium]
MTVRDCPFWRFLDMLVVSVGTPLVYTTSEECQHRQSLQPPTLALRGHYARRKKTKMQVYRYHNFATVTPAITETAE